MSFTKGGTITLAGKTYNISQINSVYIGSVNRYGTGGVWGLWFMGGIVGAILFGVISNAVGSSIAGLLWTIATFAAIIGAGVVSGMQDYAVFFDMS